MIMREEIEWSDFWWEKGGDFETPRVALVGDSITRAYGNMVRKTLTGHGLMTDRFASSRCAADPVLAAELDYIFGKVNGYTYKVIHFNNGLHGGCNDTLFKVNEYKKGYKECCDVIRRNQPQAKLILVTTTNRIKVGAPVDEFDGEYNDFVLERNEFVHEYAKEQGLPVDDLYEFSAWKPEFPHPDGIHFPESACALLAEQVCRSILENI